MVRIVNGGYRVKHGMTFSNRMGYLLTAPQTLRLIMPDLIRHPTQKQGTQHTSKLTKPEMSASIHCRSPIEDFQGRLGLICSMPYKEYYVYILTNYSRTVLYTGITENVEGRVFQHKQKFNQEAFTAKYKADLLVWFETHNDVNQAIRREKLIKRWRRKWKEELINEENPEWEDLSKGWYD